MRTNFKPTYIILISIYTDVTSREDNICTITETTVHLKIALINHQRCEITNRLEYLFVGLVIYAVPEREVDGIILALAGPNVLEK